MRAWSLSLAALGVAGSLALNLGGCGSSSSSTGSGGGGTTSGGDPCDPANLKACTPAQQVTSDCVALVDYSKSETPTLRMMQISITAPESLTNPLVRTLIDNGVTINLPQCNIGSNGASSQNGNFNWLLQFDLAHGKLKTGGAKPVPDPTKGYAFATGKISQNGQDFDVGPVTIDITVGSGGTFEGKGGLDLSVPVYQDKAAKTAIILPLHNAQVNMGTLSSDHNCIGTYDSKDLSPNFNCTSNEPYITAGTLSGFITLEEADKVGVPTAGTTLCAIIAGMPTAKSCARKNGMITYKGDFCSTTMKPGGCEDSVQLSAKFAAAAVKVN
jgi:hypothetical protein